MGGYFEVRGTVKKAQQREREREREKAPVVRGKGEHIRAVDGTPTIAHV